jgi:hypothetical protein
MEKLKTKGHIVLIVMLVVIALLKVVVEVLGLIWEIMKL